MGLLDVPRRGGIDVVREFQIWNAADFAEATTTMAKLCLIANMGLGQVQQNAWGRDRQVDKDMWCRERNGWLCFYVAQSAYVAPSGHFVTSNRVVAIYVVQVGFGGPVYYDDIARRRRPVLQV